MQQKRPEVSHFANNECWIMEISFRASYSLLIGLRLCSIRKIEGSPVLWTLKI